MFKKLILATLCSVAMMSGAQAADSVDLKVTGTLTSGTCTPTLENGGVVDYGHIPWGNLSKTETNQLGHKMINLTITCSSSMAVGFGPVDNRADSRMAILIKNAKQDGSDLTPWLAETFGLGKTAGGVNLGGIAIAPMSSETKVDGASAILIRTQHADANPVVWEATEGLMDYGSRKFTVAKTGTLEPLPFKEAVIPLKISTSVQGTDTLNMTDETNLDGSITLGLYYF